MTTARRAAPPDSWTPGTEGLHTICDRLKKHPKTGYIFRAKPATHFCSCHKTFTYRPVYTLKESLIPARFSGMTEQLKYISFLAVLGPASSRKRIPRD